jgi:hypothetical protein
VDKQGHYGPDSNFNRTVGRITAARKVIDEGHANLARVEFIGPAWEKHFSYRKSGKTLLMKKDQEIAVRYRKHKGILSPYDEYT